MDLGYFAVTEFDLVHKVVFTVASDAASVVKLYVDDFAGLAVEVVVWPCFFVEYEFDSVAYLVCLRDRGITL
ncbi:hypothetical protein [Halobaculum limi]|uniref:hypothetical protein n=1 Tax=Halobaculum limi TaxID=3031916 RepID=UPI0024057746|nr:hypothetical protein [Halobaculum sp. YSMS11]